MKKIFIKIKEWFESYKNSMLKVDNKNLSGASKVSLGVFIIIVFIIIGGGVNSQQSSIVHPDKKFSYKCLMFIEKNIEIDKFQTRDISRDIYGEYYRHKYWILEDFKYNHHRESEREILNSFGSDSLCQSLGKIYLDLANSETLEDKLIIQKGLKHKIALFEGTISTKTQEYSNALLENIAKQEHEYSILSTNSKSIKRELRESRKKLKILENELSKVENITEISKFKEFKKYLDTNDEKILRAYKEALNYYRLEYTLNIFIFLFPVWLLFYIVYRLFKNRGHYVSAYLSVNVANVSALYLIFNIFILIYTIIPKVFLGKLIEFLSQYNLTLVLNIGAIIFFMLIFGLFIHRIQKNSNVDNTPLNKTRVKNLRVKAQDTCLSCGNKYNEVDKFCGYCCEELVSECKSCHEVVFKSYTFCTQCSQKL